MEESIFLDYVGDNPRMRILQSLNILVPKLAELGIIIKTRKIGRATLYKINQNNFAVKQFIALYDQLILEKLNNLENVTANKVEVVA
ncbi:hypothetical protein HYU21_05020 [Candidatus Woesearchaeota archaeon]|nr:hypothetical protein [Candidatus Woesearchaeota archaeon]